ncbi:MAG TPA: hypothetical protein H9851_03560 [Candidatus Borkfalkia faecavium]|uniref:Uncharacterized protein n=1 Tax=Candidatus Borkfalkia faecavium TaxID=2838508 RepID=A0A9D1W150_9FIRM|nr:hypothetical protein [Candidatus Borkfalkia faecavium]
MSALDCAAQSEFSSSRHVLRARLYQNAANSPFLHEPHVCGNWGRFSRSVVLERASIFSKATAPASEAGSTHAYYIYEKIFEQTKIFSVSLKNTPPSALWAERPEFSSSRHIFKGTPLSKCREFTFPA